MWSYAGKTFETRSQVSAGRPASTKNDPATARVAVVLLSARQQEADIMRGFALGADDYVVKPFSPVELIARVKRLLRKPSA